MKDPVLIGGKSSSPGPKIVKKMIQEELLPDKLMTTGACAYEKYLLKGIKEKVDSLDFISCTKTKEVEDTKEGVKSAWKCFI